MEEQVETHVARTVHSGVPNVLRELPEGGSAYPSLQSLAWRVLGGGCRQPALPLSAMWPPYKGAAG